LTLLIDLDGIDATVVALVLEFTNGLLEGAVDFADAVRMSVKRRRMGS
jgi:hypothetical protein